MKIMGADIDLTHFQRADAIGFHRNDIFLVLKFPLDYQELAAVTRRRYCS
jgi:hypothetical protein